MRTQHATHRASPTWKRAPRHGPASRRQQAGSRSVLVEPAGAHTFPAARGWGSSPGPRAVQGPAAQTWGPCEEARKRGRQQVMGLRYGNPHLAGSTAAETETPPGPVLFANVDLRAPCSVSPVRQLPGQATTGRCGAAARGSGERQTPHAAAGPRSHHDS